MGTRVVFLALALALLADSAGASGPPEIQITIDNDQITTRALLKTGPYSAALTSPKSVYVMPMANRFGIWSSYPNSVRVGNPPTFPTGPGLAYGYDLVDGGPQAFAQSSIISVDFLDGLKLWNGSDFADPGNTQIKGTRGDPRLGEPTSHFSITSDAGPFDSVSLTPVAPNYEHSVLSGNAGSEVNGHLSWVLLGDGLSPTSASPDGVYLLKMQVSSTQAGLMPSEPYFFVLDKNATDGDVAAAVASLNISSDLIQVVPEPRSWLLASLGSALWSTIILVNRRKRHA